MNFIHSIKFRFTIWYLLVLVVLLCILGTSIYFFLSRGLYRNLDHDLELRAAHALDGVEAEPPGRECGHAGERRGIARLVLGEEAALGPPQYAGPAH